MLKPLFHQCHDNIAVFLCLKKKKRKKGKKKEREREREREREKIFHHFSSQFRTLSPK